MTAFALVISWLFFYLLHSITASHMAKNWFLRHFPTLFPHYRLIYNLISVVTVLPALYWLYFFPGPSLWEWTGPVQLIANGIAVAAIVGFFVSTRYYDGAAFLGLKPDHSHRVGNAIDTFTLSPFHRYVRHPWYFFGLLLIWTRDMSLSWFITCAFGTLYLYIGSKWEEKKLTIELGERYRVYCERVPALIPLPWRHLSKQQAKELLEL